MKAFSINSYPNNNNNNNNVNPNMTGLNSNIDNADGIVVTKSTNQSTSQQMATMPPSTQKLNPIQTSKQGDYMNGRVKSEPRVNYETYYSHKEQTPDNYHPLVQYLDTTELKYFNDNLFYETPMGFPTKAW
jgi:hypothetical protein